MRGDWGVELRRRGMPSEVRHALTLVGSERPIAWGSGPGLEAGTTAFTVTTERALHLVRHGTDRRVPWDRIVKATWTDPMLEMVVQPEPGGPTSSLRIQLDDPGEVPVVVRERVTASIVVQEHVDLEGDRGARMVARRDSDSGALRWSVVFDSGLDPRDPDLRARAQIALADLRAQLGV